MSFEIPLGATRFNSDSQKLEYWNGSAWYQVLTFSPNLDGGTRGCISMGGDVPSFPGTIEYITIPTQGNATDLEIKLMLEALELLFHQKFVEFGAVDIALGPILI